MKELLLKLWSNINQFDPKEVSIFNAIKGVDDKIDSIPLSTYPYKSYVALLNQSVSGGPIVATVLENTLGGNIVWTPQTTTYSTGLLIGAFPINKIIICNMPQNLNYSQSNYYTVARETDNQIQVNIVGGTSQLVDNLVVIQTLK